MKLHKFRSPPTAQPTGRVYRGPQEAEDERLTGQVNGKKASDIEERFYRGTRKDRRIQWVRFETVYGAPSSGMYGSAELDFLIFTGTHYPVQLDGEWIHKSAEARYSDYEHDLIIMERLRARGVQEINRVRGKFLQTQKDADSVVQQILSGRVYKP